MKVNNKINLDYVVSTDGKRHLCSATIKDQPAGWRVRRGYGNNCQRHAVYHLNGELLCRIHAGAFLLDLLLKDHPTHYYITSVAPRLQRKP